MNPLQVKNAVYTGASGRKSIYDLTIPENWNGKLIVFIHGYMGFKDWGCWQLVDSFFVDNSYGFLRYNVSHNGGTVDNPIDFPDPEAFSINTYSKELKDFELIIDHVQEQLGKPLDIYTIGHSRGGGIAALQSQHLFVKKWCSWASICSIEERFPSGEDLIKWKESAYRYVKNGRTKQDLPLHYNQYEDYILNRDRLNIENYCKKNDKPCLLIHGSEDASVLPEEGERLARWTQTELQIIDDAQHTFNSSHPWNDSEMPEALLEACTKTLTFFEV